MKVLKQGGGKTFASALFVFAGILLSVGRVMAQPDTLWTRRYDSGYYDYASDVAVDDSGNIIVTGTSYTDTNYFRGDYLTIKYSPSGNTLWTKRYDSGSHDGANGVAVDDSGNIIVTGTSYTDTNYSNYDYLTIKYSSSGDTLWTRRYNSGWKDRAKGVTVDISGNIIVTGWSNYDIFTIKYDQLGDTIWTKRYDYGNDSYGVAVDDSGNIFIAGEADDHYLTMKCNPSGDTIWTRRYDSGANFDCARGVAVDNAGNVIITGETDCGCKNSCNPIAYGYCTIKYTPWGDTIWTRWLLHGRYGGRSCDVAINDSGNVILAGGYYVTNDYDYLVLKYSASGDSLWSRYYDNGYSDYAHSVAVDDSENIIVTGGSKNVTNYDYLTIKYRNDLGIEEDENANCKVQDAKLGVYPNPFVKSTIIQYQLPVKEQSVLKDL